MSSRGVLSTWIAAGLISIAPAALAQPAPNVCTNGSTFAQVAMLALSRSNTVYMILPDGSQARRLPVSGARGTLIGFDLRPSDGLIYGLSDSNELYTLSMQPTQVIANRVATLNPAFNGGVESLTDFNPTNNGAGNALRIIGKNDQNYALVSTAGGPPTQTVVQTSLAYAAGDPAAGADPSVTAGAYDSNQNGTATTTFYMLDADRNTFLTINGRNATGSSNTAGGQLKTIGNFVDAAGALIDVSTRSGLDIYTPVAGQNIGVAITARDLYCIDLGAVNPDAAVGTTANVVGQKLTRESGSLARATSDDILDIAVVPLQPADISVQVFDSPDPISRGETLSYRVLIQNQGPFDAVNVTMSNSQLVLTSPVATPSQGSCASASQCSLGSLVSGASATVTVRGAVPANLQSGATFTGSFSANSANPDPQPANNSASTVTTVR
ncbi:MAG TPA: DUF4394 domain-containing protein [Polyangiales bacterium]|nr:DUF4394 domain-containing protein [Polyangiales bacterium]